MNISSGSSASFHPLQLIKPSTCSLLKLLRLDFGVGLAADLELEAFLGVDELPERDEPAPEAFWLSIAASASIVFIAFEMATLYPPNHSPQDLPLSSLVTSIVELAAFLLGAVLDDDALEEAGGVVVFRAACAARRWSMNDFATF